MGAEALTIIRNLTAVPTSMADYTDGQDSQQHYVHPATAGLGKLVGLDFAILVRRTKSLNRQTGNVLSDGQR